MLTAQGKSIAEAARSIGVSEQTYYRWGADYGSMKTDQVKRLKELIRPDGYIASYFADGDHLACRSVLTELSSTN